MADFKSWGVVSLLSSLPACCVAASTRVRTPDGEVAAGSLRVGDALCSVDVATGRLIVGRVVAIRRATRECLRLRWAGGSLVCTPDHPLYEPRRASYRPASDWITGDARALLAWSEAGVSVVRVTGEPYVGVHEVLDLTVDAAEHNFVAAGVVVHNKSLGSPVYRADLTGPEITLAPGQAQEFHLRACLAGEDFEVSEDDFVNVDVDTAIGEHPAGGDEMRLSATWLTDAPPLVRQAFVPGMVSFDATLPPKPCSDGVTLSLARLDSLPDGVITVNWFVWSVLDQDASSHNSIEYTLTLDE